MVDSQGGSNETDEITDDTSTESEDDSITSASLKKEEVFDISLSFTGLYGLARGDDTSEESWLGGRKLERE
jgi:hypothetical protein